VDKVRNNLKITYFKDLIELGYLEVLNILAIGDSRSGCMGGFFQRNI
jgi:hypothetical protein